MLIPNLNEIPELGAVPEGEYDLRATVCKKKKANTGTMGIMFVFEIVGEENADEFFHTIWTPKADGTPKTIEKSWRMFGEAFAALGIEVSERELEDIVEDCQGLECSALLIQKPHYQDEDKMVNEIKRFT